MLFRARPLIPRLLPKVQRGKAHFLSEPICLVLHCRVLSRAYPQFLPRQGVNGVDDDMAMYGLGVGVGGDHAFAIGEEPRRQFLCVDVRILRRHIVFPVAGQFEVIEFPFLILLALAIEQRRLLELFGIIFILE